MRADTVFILLKPGDVRRNVVNAWVIAAWKQKTHVDHDNIVIVFNRGHIFADTHLANAADRNNFKRWTRCAWFFRLHRQTKLFAAIAVIHRLIHRHVNYMLRRLRLHTFTRTALRSKNFPFARCRSVKDSVISFFTLLRALRCVVRLWFCESLLTHR